MTDERSIELEVEVTGTPEEVWAAIATGPGISSWYVPHRIEEIEGGDASASFGPGMDVAGRVTGWEPPYRFAYQGVEGGPQLAFEWFVESREGGVCTVRLVNSGFGTGTEWDDHFDAMTEGWRTFMLNLQLHLAEFRGRPAVASLPMGSWEVDSPTDAWTKVAATFGFDPELAVGDAIELTSSKATRVVGTVRARSANRISFVTTEPAEGTGFVTAEGSNSPVSVSVWLYLYGNDAAAKADDHYREWTEALARSTGG